MELHFVSCDEIIENIRLDYSFYSFLQYLWNILIFISTLPLVMMPCYSPADNIITCKLICMYPQNQKRFNLSTHIVYIVVFDAVTGELVSLMVSYQKALVCYDLVSKIKFRNKFLI